jgi:hypothetical protein
VVCARRLRQLLHLTAAAGLPHRRACRAQQSPDKTLRLLSDFWHVLTKEQGNERLLAECVEWMQARLK